MISFCITVCNEHFELDRLLKQLFRYIDNTDQIVVQGDQGNVTDEVISILSKYKKDERFVYVEYPLNRDFATFKNNAIKHCTKQWNFLIDADEYCDEFLLTHLKQILTDNSDIDVFKVPRVNTVEGITPEYLKQRGWLMHNINGIDVINFPDSQYRIFKNNKKIKYINTVHECLSGYDWETVLPISKNGKYTFDYCLYHPKSIERQIKQNNFYDTLVKF